MLYRSFNLKTPQNKVPLEKQRETLIFMVLRFDGNRIKISTEEKILPSNWVNSDATTERPGYAKRKHSGYTELNQKILRWFTESKELFDKYENTYKRKPSADEFKELVLEKLTGATTGQMTLYRFIEKFIEDSKKRVNTKTGKKISESTIAIYQHTLTLLRSFQVKTKNKVDFNLITIDFYNEFVEYLRTEHNFSNNTIGKHIKTLKTFIKKATRKGYNTNLDFQDEDFTVLKEETKAIYLNESELKQMYDLDLSNEPRLDRVRDLFLIGCWTGLRFSDLSSLKHENFKEKKIEIKQKKTGELVPIPFHPVVRSIMKKYQDQPNSLPPFISNVKMNEYIKEVAEKLKCLKDTVTIETTKGGKTTSVEVPRHDLITVHTARRSFASNLYKDKFPSRSIMKITGHKSEKAFQSYLKLTPDEHSDLLADHWEKKYAEAE